jgi:putative transposase
MLLAHKIELRPTADQANYLDRACGARRHCYNQLLEHFKQPGVTWSKAAAYQDYLNVIRPRFPWYNEVSSRVTRNAIDDLDKAFKHFFRRVKAGQKPGFPTFKKKGQADSFALREAAKFDVDGRKLRIEKLPTRIKRRQKLRFTGKTKQATISKRAGKFFVSILVDTQDYNPHAPDQEIVGVDFGLKSLAALSTGEVIPANQQLKATLKRLKRRRRNLSRKQNGSNRRARAKLRVARLHLRVANQRQAVIHELSDHLTRAFKTVVIEDLNVKGMARGMLARAVNDAGFGMLRQAIEYKAELRGVTVIVADRWFPSTRTCNACGQLHDMPLGKDTMHCECGNSDDRDLNAARNLELYGRSALLRDLKRAPESSKTASAASALTA